MNISIKVTSPSFSKNKMLSQELRASFDDVELHQSSDKLHGDQLLQYLSDADAAIIGLEPIDESLLSACPKLKYIAKYGVGLDNIDLDACERHGVGVGWTPGTNKRSVSEMVLSFMISLGRNMYPSSMQLKSGLWNKSGGMQLTGKTVGIIGVGNVGKDLIDLLQPFGCKILVNDVLNQKEYYDRVGVIGADKQTIYLQADFVTLHVPLTEHTLHLIDDQALSQFKPSAFLINTSRGKIVSQSAIKAALTQGKIAGAALDVYEIEPPTDKELLQMNNLFCTPHIGGNSEEAVLAMGRSAIAHLESKFITANG